MGRGTQKVPFPSDVNDGSGGRRPSARQRSADVIMID